MDSDEKWLRERNRRFGVGVNSAKNTRPCIYRGKPYPSLAAAARSTGAKVETVHALAIRISDPKSKAVA